MAHMLMHFIETTVDNLRNDIDVFASRNMKWIEKVGCDFFEQEDVSPDVYIKEIVSGGCKFDAMAILLACICHNIHAMLLLQKSYWTTRSKNDYAMTFIKLAFIGDSVFKFIVPCDPQKEVQSDVPNDTVQASDDDMDLEDLAETGLLPSDKEDSSSDSTSEGGNGNVDDSRENDFEGEHIDTHSDAGDSDAEDIVLMPMDVANTVHNVQQPLNSTMDVPNTDNSVNNVQHPLNTTVDVPNTDTSVDQSFNSTVDVSNTDKTSQGDTSAEAKTS